MRDISAEMREIPDHILEEDDIAGALGEDLSKVHTALLLKTPSLFLLRLLPHLSFQCFLPTCSPHQHSPTSNLTGTCR